MEHDLLQNVMERVWLLLPSQGCSTQFLHEGMKLPPPLFPPSLFHLPCAGSSVPVGELGGFTKPPKCSRRRSWRKASPGVRRRYQQNHADGTVARIEGGQLPWCEAKRGGQESEQLAPHRNPPSLPQDSRGASPPHALALRCAGQGRCGTRPRHPRRAPPCPSAASTAVGAAGAPRGTARCLTCPLPHPPAEPAGAAPRARAAPSPVAPGGSRRLPAAPGADVPGAAAGQGRGGAERSGARGGRRIHGRGRGRQGSLPEHGELLRLVP
ncbi:translation initiation factor IF-2-like isoform X1 [Corvus kubaryi]|uniref:translation initiation factor IF-2-like isoform X1 n=1 Tax=Corvus kubaryi TaxID=68294 RepID=UPI001C03A735|nr:translation initiation factor IF-2-like isoform X1 [Corvus kubaryi]